MKLSRFSFKSEAVWIVILTFGILLLSLVGYLTASFFR